MTSVPQLAAPPESPVNGIIAELSCKFSTPLSAFLAPPLTPLALSELTLPLPSQFKTLPSSLRLDLFLHVLSHPSDIPSCSSEDHFISPSTIDSLPAILPVSCGMQLVSLCQSLVLSDLESKSSLSSVDISVLRASELALQSCKIVTFFPSPLNALNTPIQPQSMPQKQMLKVMMSEVSSTSSPLGVNTPHMPPSVPEYSSLDKSPASACMLLTVEVSSSRSDPPKLSLSEILSIAPAPSLKTSKLNIPISSCSYSLPPQ
jgi:hypothetical protein